MKGHDLADASSLKDIGASKVRFKQSENRISTDLDQ